jgi:hypothetical protein
VPVSSYEIDRDVVIVRAAPDSFPQMAEVVRAATQDTAAFGAQRRLLIDLRGVLHGLNYEDLRFQAQALASMRTVLAPRWAVLATNRPATRGAATMFAILAEVEHVTTTVFEDEEEALDWLRQEDSDSSGGPEQGAE